jgi:outer membrane receptor protein involved in Fe transport
LGADYSYVSSRYGDFLSSPPPPDRPLLPAYGVGNVHAGIDDGKYSADLWVHNVGNGRGLLAANSGQLSQQLDTWVATIVQPLTVGISLAAKF